MKTCIFGLRDVADMRSSLSTYQEGADFEDEIE